METSFLFKHKYKKIGAALVIIGLLALVFFLIFPESDAFTKVPIFYIWEKDFKGSDFLGTGVDDFRMELIFTLLVVGSVLLGFSKLQSEDEFTMKIRLESLLWATYLSLAYFLCILLFIYGFVFLDMLFICLPLFLALFNIRFHYCLHKLKSEA